MDPIVEQYSVKPVGFRIRCPKCNEGFMNAEEVLGIDYFTRLKDGDPSINHICNKCGFTKRYNKQYPYVEFVEE